MKIPQEEVQRESTMIVIEMIGGGLSFSGEVSMYIAGQIIGYIDETQERLKKQNKV